MPQQQSNGGFLSQNANRGCRFCDIVAGDRGRLDYDIVAHGHFHHEIVRVRTHMDGLSKGKRNEYARSRGLNVEAPPLIKIAPALDIIMSRPSDPAHSEFGGVSKLIHELLVDAILTPAAQKKYAAVLR
jgi:hypothetical protein